MSPAKLELRKTMKEFYNPPAGEVVLVKLPPLKYIMVDGEGEPGGESFQQAMGAIYNVAYSMKFRSKRLLKKDYDMMAPEGLWWMKGKIDMNKRDKWLWTLMILVPDFVTPEMFSDSVAEVRSKKNPPGLERARLDTLDEGTSLQIMHVGPYATESESIAKMDAYAKEHGYKMVEKHHEIYLGDPRRAAPSKLRTVLRHPVAKALA
ncbi:MAG TPA: GyrI-like domain-containing protein [Nitrososphaerales archaeon]|nr:GyrI-like domain-containing protein [Nitrososphaerales archaeon]